MTRENCIFLIPNRRSTLSDGTCRTAWQKPGRIGCNLEAKFSDTLTCLLEPNCSTKSWPMQRPVLLRTAFRYVIKAIKEMQPVAKTIYYKVLLSAICLHPRGELIDFYDGVDHVRPFSQTPKYADQIFQDPKYVD